MATGTGKTYTALAAISRLFADKEQNLAVIIICPYQHLVEQWKEDIVAFGMKRTDAGAGGKAGEPANHRPQIC